MKKWTLEKWIKLRFVSPVIIKLMAMVYATRRLFTRLHSDSRLFREIDKTGISVPLLPVFDRRRNYEQIYDLDVGSCRLYLWGNSRVIF